MWPVLPEINRDSKDHIYGYTIEYRYNDYDKHILYDAIHNSSWNRWENFHKHKIYKTEDIAKEALSHIKEGFPEQWSFRIRALYY